MNAAMEKIIRARQAPVGLPSAVPTQTAAQEALAAFRADGEPLLSGYAAQGLLSDRVHALLLIKLKAGAEYYVAAIIGNQAAACSANLTYASASFLENCAI